MLKSYLLKGFLVVVLCLGITNARFLMSNTYYSLSHDAFDGFSSPITQTVDWVNLPLNQHKSSFHEVSDSYKINLPDYDTDILLMPLGSVGFKSASDLNIRNSKISYSVPYLGNYKFDGHENAGSHPGVDIKLLKNTPLYSIANGVVVKAVKSNIGFGNYIVVLHKGVVDPLNVNLKTDIYSTYAHLDRILVEEGQVVSKSQMIAFSGDSGLATTAHLDFQINTKDVPFLPYWPFNVNEISAQGYDFVSAVNQGVGITDAIKYTVNPFEYIAKFKDFSWNTQSLSSQLDSYRVETVVAFKESSSVVDSPNDTLPSAPTDLPDLEVEDFKVESVNFPANYIYIKDSTLKIVSSGVFDPSKVRVESDLLDVKFIDSNQNSFSFNLSPNAIGSEYIKVYYDDTLLDSKEIFVSVFRDMNYDDTKSDLLKSLVDKKILNGYLDGSIDLHSSVSKVESIVLISRLIDPNIGINSESWYQDQLNFAIQNGAVNKDILLSESLNLAEFLKIIYEILSVDISFTVHEFYSDLFDVSAWYAPYVQEAYRKNIISNNDLLFLGKPLTRYDLFELLYEFSNFIY
mgnify:FL=1